MEIKLFVSNLFGADTPNGSRDDSDSNYPTRLNLYVSQKYNK